MESDCDAQSSISTFSYPQHGELHGREDIKKVRATEWGGELSNTVSLTKHILSTNWICGLRKIINFKENIRNLGRRQLGGSWDELDRSSMRMI